ncbi:MAG: GspE/PulE family protein [Patescibacteria group bacterium]
MPLPSSEKIERVAQELLRGENLSIINLFAGLLEEAHGARVSDIHIDPNVESVRIRFRIDGVLQHAHDFPKKIHSEIISRIKVLARLRTDEHQATQDGRFRHIFSDTNEIVDIRVSIVPTYHGENAVLRLLSDRAENFSLENLGFSKNDIEKISTAMKKTSGMILSTGPTGSGKTTTLYTLVKMLSTPEVSVITIEDPIEYAVSDIEQIQVNAQTKLSFANGLRSILRQDPNIIMVGEIRDAETATVAVNAALTGHLVLSTLHTNDAATTLPRLLDMGIEEYLIASTVTLAIGQRLVRKICQHCAKEVTLPTVLEKNLAGTTLEKILRDSKKIRRGAGCMSCGNSGYRGRISINEVLVADDAIKEAIIRRAPASKIKKIATAEGMTTMMEDGCKKVAEGITTLEEILRVVHE